MDRDSRNGIGPDDEAPAELFRRQPGRAACPPPDLVQAAQAGALPEALQARVAAHVERCSMCRALSEALDDASVGSLTAEEQERILERVRSGIGEATPTRVRSRRWQWYAAAAGVALAATGSVLVWQFRRAPIAPASPMVARNVRQPVAPPVFRLEKPAIQGRGAPDILLRGSSKPGEAEDLARALEPYRTDDFAEVVRRLGAVIRRHPQSAVGHFFLGVSEMFLDRNAEALAALQAAERLAKDYPSLRREITWYLALAYHRTGQSTSASDNLESLCRGQGPGAARACLALRELAGPLTLSGVVVGRGGVPLAGAVVSEYAGRVGPDVNMGVPTGLSATTDSSGHYRVSGFVSARTPSVGLRASKVGYFTSLKSLVILGDTEIDFVLEPWVHMSLGEVVRRRVQPGDTVCGDPNERCHYFALTVPAGGTLEVSLASTTSAQTWDLHVETPSGEVFGPLPLDSPLPLRVTIAAEAKSTYQIRVVCISDSPREFELTTRLR